MLKFIFQKIMILSILLLFLITIGGCNKKQTEYLTDPIAIVYKNDICLAATGCNRRKGR